MTVAVVLAAGFLIGGALALLCKAIYALLKTK